MALPSEQVGSGPGGHLASGVAVFPDGRTIVAVVLCGSRLVARETQGEVLVTWVASAVGPGGMSCARIPLTAHLRRSLGTRRLVDGVTGAQLRPTVCRTSNGSFSYDCT